VSVSALDTESVARRWLKEDSVFIDSLPAGGFTTPPVKFSLAGVRLGGSSVADVDLGDWSTNGLLLGVVECLNDVIIDLPALVGTVCAGGAI